MLLPSSGTSVVSSFKLHSQSSPGRTQTFKLGSKINPCSHSVGTQTKFLDGSKTQRKNLSHLVLCGLDASGHSFPGKFKCVSQFMVKNCNRSCPVHYTKLDMD